MRLNKNKVYTLYYDNTWHEWVFRDENDEREGKHSDEKFPELEKDMAGVFAVLEYVGYDTKEIGRELGFWK